MLDKVTVAIAGANEEKIFDLVDSFKNQHVEFHLYGVGDTTHQFADHTNYQSVEDDQEAVSEAVKEVVDGTADILFKGLVQTHTLLKEVLKKEYQLVQKNLLSHVSIIDIPTLKRPLLLTDAAMNIIPDFEQEKSIIENAIEVAHSLQIKKPKVALLSSAENFNQKMPSSLRAKELTDYYATMEKDAIIYGPLSLDISLSPEIAVEKKFTGPIAGDADVLVVPNIDVGNVLYKSLTLFGNASAGGIIVGTKVPIVITSRGDSLKSKIISLNLALDVISKDR